MAEEHRFSAEPEASSPPTQGKTFWQSCLTGCLIAFVIAAVLAVLLGIWVSRNWRNWVASLGTEGMRAGIQASDLPAQEKQEIMVQVDRVAKAFRERTISDERLASLFEQLAKSSLMTSMMASALDAQYIAKSGLSAEEKTAGRQALQRFIRGTIDGKINEAGVDAAMAHVATKDPGGEWKLREPISDADLRAFLDEAKKQADAAGIPEQIADVDPSEEFKRIVDEALGAPQ